ncbi:MAG TPA: cytochrome c oxidase assembly protein [Terriglobales bacterium]|nr:cytochrome c oxidase assembly protein [Terriglobales bacterium]
MRRLLQLGAMLLYSGLVYAHEEPGGHLTRAQAERTWSFEPVVVIPVVLTGLLFAMGAVQRWGRPGWSWAQVGSFAAGWLTLILALVSPIHKLGSLLFSIHMTQHELLMIVAAPLLVFARPIVWFLWALPRAWRERAGAWAKNRKFAAVWAAMTLPLFVWLLHGATLWAWHIPYLYDAAVQYESVHALQHTMFLFTALLFWWTLVHGRYGRLAYGVAVVYVFTTAIHTSILGALMTFTQQIWYPIYDGRTHEFHLTPLEDQQLGGLIMWIPAGVVFIILGLWLMAAWLRESEKRVGYTRAEEVSRGA